ncbi:MAG: hypothetical protein GY950_00810 [bacterium]|nr:hypothetical protein [bacterium]
MSDAAIIAIAGAIKALADLTRVNLEGATPEQREKLWAYYITDMERWRKFWGVDEAKK